MHKKKPSKKDLLLEIAEFGLKGDKQEIVKVLEGIAAKEISANRHTSYNRILNLVERYSDEVTSIASSASVDSQDLTDSINTESVWLAPSIKSRVEKFIRLHREISNSYATSSFNKLLLYGPPGSGKTTIGFYIAQQLGQPIKYVKITDVISSRLGETMHNIASIFLNSSNEVIFIDEFDAFAKDRGDRNDVGELKRIVNSIIQTLDFQSKNKIVIVATNLVESIDPAIIRRFKFKILIDELANGEKEEFVDFFIKEGGTKEVTIQLEPKDRSFVVRVLDILDVNTIASITDFLDKALVNSLIDGRKKVTLDDLIRTLFIEDYLRQAKKIHKRDEKVFSKLCKRMESLGYPKTKIAEALGIHRNSYNTYAS